METLENSFTKFSPELESSQYRTPDMVISELPLAKDLVTFLDTFEPETVEIQSSSFEQGMPDIQPTKTSEIQSEFWIPTQTESLMTSLIASEPKIWGFDSAREFEELFNNSFTKPDSSDISATKPLLEEDFESSLTLELNTLIYPKPDTTEIQLTEELSIEDTENSSFIESNFSTSFESGMLDIQSSDSIEDFDSSSFWEPNWSSEISSLEPTWTSILIPIKSDFPLVILNSLDIYAPFYLN